MSALPKRLADSLDVIYTPLLHIEPTGEDARIGPEDAAIFTSSNGVKHAPEGNGRKAFCVGRATTSLARDRGWNAHEAGQTATELVERLLSNLPDLPLFHLSGTHTRGHVVQRLTDAGAVAQRVILYDQRATDLTDAAHAALASGKPVLVPLFSPRTATQFFAQSPDLSHAVIFAFSDTIADCAPPEHRPAVIVSSAPDAQAMAKALQDAVHRLASG